LHRVSLLLPAVSGRSPGEETHCQPLYVRHPEESRPDFLCRDFENYFYRTHHEMQPFCIRSVLLVDRKSQPVLL